MKNLYKMTDNYLAKKKHDIIFLNRISIKLRFLPSVVRKIVELPILIICLPFMPLIRKNNRKIFYNHSSNKKIFEFTYKGKDIKFHLPYLLYDDGTSDHIQRFIFVHRNFYEFQQLKRIRNRYIRENSVIFDIGSNIGNHVVYWGKICNAKMIYCFEPVESTYAILKDNIKINNLENKTTCFNCAVGKTDGFADIKHYDKNNIGGTSIIETENGDIKILSIDSLNSIEAVDFIKIDVEGFEYEVLQGCKKTLEKYKPIVFTEILPNNFSKVDSFFRSISFSLYEKIDSKNFIYKSTEI